MHQFLLIALVCVVAHLHAQDTVLLKQKLSNAKTIREKIMLIDTVAYLYMLDNKHDTLSDELGIRALDMAEQTGDKELLAYTLYLNARRVWWDGSNAAYRNSRFHFYCRELLNLARAHDMKYYEVAALTLQGNFDIIDFNFERGTQKLNHALVIATELKHDSLISDLYGSLGDVYAYRGERILGFKYLLMSLDRAEQSGNKISIGNSKKNLAKFYHSIGEVEKGIEYQQAAIRDLETNSQTEFENIYWGKLNLSDRYFEKGDYENAMQLLLSLVEQSNLPKVFIANAHMNIFALLIKQKKYADAEKYYSAHSDIEQLLNTWDIGFFRHYMAAMVHRGKNQLDSALFHFEAATTPIPNVSRVEFLSELFSDYGEVYMLRNEADLAIPEFKKALEFAIVTGSPALIGRSYDYLQNAHARAGNYREAYELKLLNDIYADSLSGAEKNRQLLQMEVANEAQRQARLRMEQEIKTRNRHNLQYMAITMVIAVVFTLLIALGIFSTSTAIIKGIGFIAFIMLFEFIILISDNYIHHITHGEPWKVLSIKICLIAILFPLHHYIEGLIVNRLINQKKINLNWSIRTKRIWIKPKSKVSEAEEKDII